MNTLNYMNKYKLGFSEIRYIEELSKKYKVSIDKGIELYKYYEYYIGTSLEYWFIVNKRCKKHGITIEKYLYIEEQMLGKKISLEHAIEFLEIVDRFRKNRLSRREEIDVFLISKNNNISLREAYKEYQELFNEEVEQITQLSFSMDNVEIKAGGESN